MNAFGYVEARSVDEAIAQIATPGARFLGGGTNLIDLMKGGVETPVRLIDINRLPLNQIEPQPGGGLFIGALVKNSDLAADMRVRQAFPLLSQALLSGASGQLRNAATVGGNLLQRTRCYYFYDTAYAQCNKRQPGSGCAAQEGYNRIHAVLGASRACVATNPSDMNVALAALDAVVRVQGPGGPRDIPFGEFHRLPGDAPQFDTTLKSDELILGVMLPPSPFAAHSHYLKVRDRASYAFALVSAAVALSLENRRVTHLRVVLGGVAHRPWRSVGVEAALQGQVLAPERIKSAAALATEGAVPLKHNQFKIELAQRAVERAIYQAGEMA
jgi:xanthine dehydrogenase YagS FAD-binding subunit